MRRRPLVAILGVALVFAIWGTARVVDSWRYRASLERAKTLIASRSPALARRLLAESALRWPQEGEVPCEHRGKLSVCLGFIAFGQGWRVGD